MNNILIICIEDEKIKTEEIYFRNKKYKKEKSFNRDKILKNELNLNDLFFFSVDFNFSKNKMKEKLNRLLKLNQFLELECFIICDRDNKTFKDDQIKKQFIKAEEIIDNHEIKISNIYHLKYKVSGQKFEDFLRCHFENKKLYEGYSKIDKKLYENTMGENGKNLEVFQKKCKSIDANGNFKKLFAIRKTPIYL